MIDKLQEYLIALGFKIKDDEYKKFKDRITEGAAGVSKLGSAITAAALEIEAGVTKVAREFEDLYYVSQRTTTSVPFLTSMQFGAKQIGVAAEQSIGVIEKLGELMRTNPGTQGMLKAYGVTTTDPGKASIEIVERLKKQFGEKDYFAAAGIAQNFGFDERTFRQYWMNLDKLKKEQADSAQRMKDAGIEGDADAERFLKFSNAVNKLEDNLRNLGTRIAKDWIEPAQKGVETFSALIEKANEWDKQSEGWLGKAGTLVTSGLGSLLGWKVLKRFFGAPAATAGAPGAPAAASPAATVAATVSEHWIVSFFKGALYRALLAMGFLLESTVPAEGGPAIYRRDEHGNLVPTEEAIKNYVPPPTRKPRDQAVEDKQSKVQPSDDDKPPATAAGGRMDYRWFNPTLYNPAANSGPVVVNQRTDISVTGTGDPKETADAIAGSQGRVNRDLGDVVRNNLGAVR